MVQRVLRSRRKIRRAERASRCLAPPNARYTRRRADDTTGDACGDLSSGSAVNGLVLCLAELDLKQLGVEEPRRSWSIDAR